MNVGEESESKSTPPNCGSGQRNYLNSNGGSACLLNSNPFCVVNKFVNLVETHEMTTMSDLTSETGSQTNIQLADG